MDVCCNRPANARSDNGDFLRTYAGRLQGDNELSQSAGVTDGNTCYRGQAYACRDDRRRTLRRGACMRQAMLYRLPRRPGTEVKSSAAAGFKAVRAGRRYYAVSRARPWTCSGWPGPGSR